MSKTALFIRHKAKPGLRDEVRKVWEKHVPKHVSGNAAHEAYVYAFDNTDADVIVVFQLYSAASGPQDFVRQPWYPAYEAEVAPLLTGESEFRSATPVWSKP